MRDLNSATLYISQIQPMRLAIPLLGCARMGIKPVTFNTVDVHGDQYTTNTPPTHHYSSTYLDRCNVHQELPSKTQNQSFIAELPTV